MADSKELQTQLDLQNQINKALKARAKMFDAQAKQLSSQALLAKELCNAMECKDLDGLEERVGSLSGSLNDAADAASRAGGEMDKAASAPAKNLENQGNLISNITSKLSTAKVAAVTGGAAFVKAFRKVQQTLSMVFGGVKSIVGGLFDVGKTLAMVPVRILGKFVSAATEGFGSISELRQALEDVKKEMGDLAKGSGKAVVDGFDKLRVSGSALADAGINLQYIYGRGQAGLARALGALTELAGQAGASFSMLKDQFAANADKLIMMNRGLGLSGEALAEVTRRAHNAGKDVGEELVGMGNLAIQLGDRFGVSAKTIGKNMTAMITDVSNFGTLSRKELAATATFMAKLGLEAKDLQGIIDKFDDFEGAADAVSQLNQAFGIQLDTMDMLNAQNPAERIDQMRNAFFAAGKSIEDMTRQERKLLEAQTGLSGAALENAFAIENQGVAYEDMQAASEEAEANAMSEKEVMLELAKSINKFMEQGDGVDGFWNAFTKGAERGFAANQQFRESLRMIRQSLKLVYNFGRDVGKIFGELAEHMGLFDAIKKIFDPKAIGDLLGKGDPPKPHDSLLGYLWKFKESTKAGGDYDAGDMLKDMFERVKKYLLGPGADGASAFSKFFENAIRFIGDGIAAMIPFVFEKMTAFFNGLAAFIEDPKSLSKIGGAAQGGIGGAFAEAFQKIGKQLVEHGPALLDSLKTLFGAIFDKLKPVLFKIALRVILFQIVKATVIALGKAALSGAITAALKHFGLLLGGGMGDAMNKTVPKGMAKGGGGFIDGIAAIVRRAARFKTTTVAKAAKNLAMLTVLFMGTLIAFAYTVAEVAEVVGPIPWDELMKALTVIASAIGALFVISKIALTLEPATVSTAALFLAIASAGLMFSIIMFAGAVRLTYEALKPIGWGEFGKMLGMLGATLLASFALAAIAIMGVGFAILLPLILVGFAAMSYIFKKGVKTFAEAAVEVAPYLLKLGAAAPVLEKGIDMLMRIIDTISTMGSMGAKFSIIMLFKGFLVRGFDKAAGFMSDVLPHIQDVVKTIKAIPISDPDLMAKKIGIIGDIAAALQSLADVGMDAAKMGIVSEILGGPDLSTIFESMGQFLTRLAGVLTYIIKEVIKLATDLPDGDKALKKVDVVVSAINAIAGLAGALGSPLEAISEIYDSSGIIFKGDIGEIINAVVGGLGRLMGVMAAQMKSMLDQVIQMADGIADPDATMKKMDVVAKAMEGVAHFAGAIGKAFELIEHTSNDGPAWKGRSTTDRVQDVIGMINQLLPTLKRQLKLLIEHMKKVAGTITNPDEMSKQMDVVVKAMSAVGTFADVLGKMMSLSTEGDVLDPTKVSSMMEQVGTIMADLLSKDSPASLSGMMATIRKANIKDTGLEKLEVAGNVMTGLMRFTEKMMALGATTSGGTAIAGLGDAVATTIEEAQKAVTALNSMGELPVEVALDNFAKAIGTGDGEFKISNEPIEMTVKVTVNMDANQIGDVLIDKAVMTTPLATAEG